MVATALFRYPRNSTIKVSYSSLMVIKMEDRFPIILIILAKHRDNIRLDSYFIHQATEDYMVITMEDRFPIILII